MTYRKLYREIVSKLERSGCESPAFDAGCLLEHFTGVSRGILPVRGDEKLDADICRTVLDATEQRATGRPLQYIIGTWGFMSLTIQVGEGVLIPRPETELLCEKTAELLTGVNNPRVLDLCAGSGCVGLGIASLCTDASVTAVELSEQAQFFLKKNIECYPDLNVKAFKADVLKDAPMFDDKYYNAIAANPPYIKNSDIPHLMCEVRHEPVMALDGGDGFIFYRAIIRNWLRKLVPGGICAVEVGLGQAAEVADMFKNAGLYNVEIFRDIAGIERVVTGCVK
ncbi:MAG: peptide chain release factor N(5)-glutamine methyltransferase [Oscillospiraceae bacterium]|nr:peptide chain release factor N(5)-glutamine methyltransferase [Oscillospiraceae bacterium]